MPGIDDGVLIPADALRRWTQQVFERLGVTPQEAGLVTDSLIEANLRGVDTHGITRVLVDYVRRLRGGAVSARTALATVRESASTALIDARNSLGQVAADAAMRLAIAKARATGVALVAVTHSNRFGAAAYWAMMAPPEGMVGFCATNALPTMAPTGGRTPMMGTNPFAIAIPAGREAPVVLDMATTVVARGRIVLHAKQNKPLQPGWAFDGAGRPTTDPHAALQGLLAPIGGYKGYGISLAVDMLCGVMTGANYGAHFPGRTADTADDPRDVGSLFAAVQVSSFMDLEEFQARMDAAIQEIRACPKAEGVDRIYIPGEIELETKRRRLADGIPIPDVVKQELTALGETVGVPLTAG